MTQLQGNELDTTSRIRRGGRRSGRLLGESGPLKLRPDERSWLCEDVREGGGSGRGRGKTQDEGGFRVLKSLGEEATGARGEEGDGEGAGLTLRAAPAREGLQG